jgi:hypothetical protein
VVLVVTGLGGSQTTLEGFYTVLILLLRPKWVTSLGGVIIGVEVGTQEAWLCY